MSKLKIILVTSAGALVLAAVAYWLLVAQPARQGEAARVEQTLLSSGMQLFQEKKFEKALAVLQRIPGDSPHAAQARFYQGNAHVMLKDYASAAEQLEQSLALNSEDADTLFALGVAYFKLGKLQLSRAYFTSVLEFAPGTERGQAMMEEAAGLMDIMARLERQQTGAGNAEIPVDEAANDAEQPAKGD